MATIRLSEEQLRNIIQESIEGVLLGGGDEELNEDVKTKAKSFFNGAKKGIAGAINGFRAGQALTNAQRDNRWQYSKINPQDSLTVSSDNKDAAREATKMFQLAKQYTSEANNLKSQALALKRQFGLIYNKQSQSFAYPQTQVAGAGSAATGLRGRGMNRQSRFAAAGQQPTINEE